MAVLTRKEMLETINNGGISFTPPLDGFQLQPHAIDLRLGTTFYIPKPWCITEQGREAINVDPVFEFTDDQSDNLIGGNNSMIKNLHIPRVKFSDGIKDVL